MNQTAEAIKQALSTLNRPAAGREIKDFINQRYPNRFKENTLNAHLLCCSVNNPKAYGHHKSIPKIIFRRSDGNYELYDIEKHGTFSFNGTESTPTRERLIRQSSAPAVNLPYLIVDNQTFNQSKPINEAQLENMVKEHAKQIFGNDSIYFDIKTTIRTLTDVGSIPDGYAITLADKRWFIIEVELASHDPYSHILPQVTKFLNCIENHDNQHAIADALYESLLQNRSTKTFIETVLDRDTHYFLTKLVTQRPTLVIIVDEKTQKLEEACRHLNPEIIELKTFTHNDESHAHLISRRIKEETYAIRKEGKDAFVCLLCKDNPFLGNEEQIAEHLLEQHEIIEEEVESEKSRVTQSTAFVRSEKTSPSYQTDIPENELLDLTPDTFLTVLTKLGGVDVTTGQMLKYFKIIHAEGIRFGKLRYMMKKLANEQKVTYRKDEDGVYRISLKGIRY